MWSSDPFIRHLFIALTQGREGLRWKKLEMPILSKGREWKRIRMEVSHYCVCTGKE